jgi:hypothetical protein
MYPFPEPIRLCSPLSFYKLTANIISALWRLSFVNFSIQGPRLTAYFDSFDMFLC